jgi:hypothetical protein
MKRPVGVVIIGILAIIGAVLGILGALAIIGVGGLAAGAGAGVVGGGTIVIGVIYLIISVLLLIFAISFLSLKPWAWWGMLVMLGISIVWAIIGMAVGDFSVSALIGIIIDVLIIAYLYSKNVKEAFFGPRLGPGPTI